MSAPQIELDPKNIIDDTIVLDEESGTTGVTEVVGLDPKNIIDDTIDTDPPVPGDKDKDKKIEPKFVELPSSMEKDAPMSKQLDFRYYEGENSTDEEKEWLKNNEWKYRKQTGIDMGGKPTYEYYDVNAPDYKIKTNQTNLNQFGQPINYNINTPSDPSFASTFSLPVKDPTDIVNIEFETEKLINSKDQYKQGEGQAARFKQWQNASGINKEGNFNLKKDPYANFASIVTNGKTSSGGMLEQTITQQSNAPVPLIDFNITKTNKNIDKYIKNVYGVEDGSRLYWQTEADTYIQGNSKLNEWTMRSTENEYARKGEPIPENIEKLHRLARANIREKTNKYLTSGLRFQIPKYMDRIVAGLDEDSDALERVNLEKLKVDIATNPKAYTGPVKEDGSIDYDKYQEYLELDQILDQVIGGDVEEDKRVGVAGTNYGTVYKTTKKGIDLDFVKQMQKMISMSSNKGVFDMEATSPMAKSMLSEMKKEMVSEDVHFDNYIGKSASMKKRSEIAKKYLLKYINERAIKIPGGVLNLEEYAMFYDPKTKRVIRSGSSNDVVEGQAKANGFQKITTEEDLMNMIETLVESEGDVDYKQPINVLNKVNDLQFDISVLSKRLLTKFPNEFSGKELATLKANAGDGSTVENPTLLSGGDPLIMMYNDAVSKRAMLGMAMILNTDLSKTSKEGWLTGLGVGFRNIFRDKDNQITSTGNDLARETFFDGLVEVYPGIVYDKEKNPDGFTEDEIDGIYEKSLAYDIGVGTPGFVQVIAEFALTRRLSGGSIKNIGKLAKYMARSITKSAGASSRFAVKVGRYTEAFVAELSTIKLRNEVTSAAYDADPMALSFAVSAPVGLALNNFYTKLFKLSATSGGTQKWFVKNVNKVPKTVNVFTGNFIVKPGTGAIVMTAGEVPEAMLDYIKTGNKESLQHLIDPKGFVIKSAQILSTKGLAPVKDAFDVARTFRNEIRDYRDTKKYKQVYGKAVDYFFESPEAKKAYEDARNEDVRSKLLNEAIDAKLKKSGINPLFIETFKGSGLTGAQVAKVIKNGSGIDGLIEVANKNMSEFKARYTESGKKPPSKAIANFVLAIKALERAKKEGLSVEDIKSKYLEAGEYANFLNMNNLMIGYNNTYDKSSDLNIATENLAKKIYDTDAANEGIPDQQLLSRITDAGSLQTILKLGNPVLIREVLKSYNVRESLIDKIAGKINENGEWQPNGSLLLVAKNIENTVAKKGISLNNKGGEKYAELEMQNYSIDAQIDAINSEKPTDEYTKSNNKRKIDQLKEQREANENAQVVAIEDSLAELKGEALSNVAFVSARAKRAGIETKTLNNGAELKAFYNGLYKEGKISKATRDNQIKQIENPDILKKGQTVTTKDGKEIIVFNLEDIIKGADNTTGPHELVHPWVNSVIERLNIRSEEAKELFVENFKSSLTKAEKEEVDKRLKKMGGGLSIEGSSLEIFNAYAEAVAAGNIDPFKGNMRGVSNLFEKLLEGDSGVDVNFNEDGFSPELGTSIVKIINEFASNVKNDRLDDFMTQDLKNWNSKEGKQIRQEQKSGPNGSSFIEVGGIERSGVNDQFEVTQSEKDIASRNKLEGKLNTYKELQAEYPEGSAGWENYQEEIDKVERNIKTALKNKQHVVDLLNGKTTETVTIVDKDGKTKTREVPITELILKDNEGLINTLTKEFKLNDPSLEGLEPEIRLKMQEEFKQDLKGEFMFILQAYLKGYPDMTLEQRAAPLYNYLMASFRPRIGRMLQEASGGEYNPEAYKAAQEEGGFTGTLSLEDLQADSNFDVTEKDAENAIIKKAEEQPEEVKLSFGDEVIKPGGVMQIMVGLKNWVRTGNGEIKNLQENVLGFASEAIKKDISHGVNKSDKTGTKTSFKPDVYEENIRKLYPDIAKYIQKERQFLIDRRWNPMYEAILTESGKSTSRISTFEGSEVAQYETFLLSEDRMVNFLLFKGEFAVDPLKKDGTSKDKKQIDRETTNRISQRAIKFSQLVGIIKTKTMLTEAIANGGKIKIDGKEVELLSMFSENSPIKTLGDLSKALKLYDVEEGVKEDLSNVQDQAEILNNDQFIKRTKGVVIKEINSQFGSELLYENAMARAEIAIENGNEEKMITKTMTARDVVKFRTSIVNSEYSASVDKSSGSQSFETEVKDELADVEDNKFLESRGVNNAKEFADKAIERVDVLNQKKNINKENAKYNFWTNAGKVVNIVKKKAYDKMMKLYAPYTFSKKMLQKTGTKKDGTPLKNPGSVFDYNYTQAGEGYRETGNGQKLAVDTDGNPVSVPYSSSMNYSWGSKLSYNIDNSKFVSYSEQNSAANVMLSGKVSEAAKNEALNKVSNPEDVKARKQIMKTGWGGRFDFIWEEGISEAERLDRVEFLGGMVKRQSSGQVSGWRAMSPIIGGEFGSIDLLPTEIQGGTDGVRQLEHGIPMLKFSTKALSYIIKGDYDGLMKHCDTMEGFFADRGKLAAIDKVLTKTPGPGEKVGQSVKGAEIYLKPDGKGGYDVVEPGAAGSERLMDALRIPDGKGGSTTIADAIDVAVDAELSKLNKRQAKDFEGVDMQGQVFNEVYQANIDGVTIPEIKQAVGSVINEIKVTKNTKKENNKNQDIVLDQIEKVNGGAQEKKALENASTTNDQLNTATVIDEINKTGGSKDINMEHGDGSVSVYNSKNKTLTQPNKTDKISTDYKVILLAGGAGSGKSTAAKAVLSELDITKDMQMVNVDFFKEDIKKQLGLPGKETNYEDWQRSLNSRVMGIARKEKTLQQNEIVQSGKGFVLDGTLASYNVNLKTCVDLKNAGYEITILKADTSLKTALERNNKRGEKGGRSLTDKIVVETHDKVNATVEMMKKEGYSVVETNTENFKEGEVDPNAVKSVKTSLKANVITKIIPEVQDQVERNFESEANDMISNTYPDVPKGKISKSVADNIAKGKRKKFRVTPFSARHATPLLLEIVGKGDVKGYDLIKDLQEQGDYSEYQFNNYRAKVYSGVKGANKYARESKLNLSKKVLEVKDKEGNVVTKYNVEDAIRIYNWTRSGYTAKELGIEQSTVDAAKAYMKKNMYALKYSDMIFNTVNNGGKGYFKPYEGWGSNNIKQDLWRAVESRRADFFTDFDNMYKGIFSEDNLMKIKSGMGKDFDRWWEAVSDYHDRSITGRTMAKGERIGKRALNWFHGSTALALFGNVKSGFTQLLSTTNFFLADGVNIYKGMRNMFTPEYFEALRYIYKSDYMKARGSNFNLAMKELTDLETRFKEAKDAAVQTSFAISGLGDRGAITAGGAIMMVQRMEEIAPLLKEYTLSKTGEGKDGGLLLMNAVKDTPWLRDYAVAIKEGRITNKEEYMKMIMDEVAIYSEKTQQSIYAGNLSTQQTKAIGKMTLSFMNTTIKYNNLFIEEKMKMDRGLADNKKAISRMSNYIGVQGALFAFASSGLGFILMDDEMDEDKKGAIVKKKKEQALWNMMYNIVDGTGISGKAVTTIAKIIKEEYDYLTDDQKRSADILKAMMNGSPAISIKAQKLTSAEYDVKDVYKKWKATGEIDGDMIKSGLRGATKIFSFATNFGGPEFAMALMDKYGFIMDERYTFWQHAGVLMGWSMYSMDEDVYKNLKKDTKSENKSESNSGYQPQNQLNNRRRGGSSSTNKTSRRR